MLINDRNKDTAVNFGSMLVTSNEGCFVAYATAAADNSVRIAPRKSFCAACKLDNETQRINTSAFISLLEKIKDTDSNDQLVGVNFPDKKIGRIYVVALTGEQLGQTNIIKYIINLIDNSKKFIVPNLRLHVSRR